MCSGGAGSHQGFPGVHADQREEDQHPEPAAAEHAGRPAAPLRIFSGKPLETLTFSCYNPVMKCDERLHVWTSFGASDVSRLIARLSVLPFLALNNI